MLFTRYRRGDQPKCMAPRVGRTGVVVCDFQVHIVKQGTPLMLRFDPWIIRLPDVGIGNLHRKESDLVLDFLQGFGRQSLRCCDGKVGVNLENRAREI